MTILESKKRVNQRRFHLMVKRERTSQQSQKRKKMVKTNNIIDDAIDGFQEVVNSSPITKAIDKAMQPIVELIPGHEKLEEHFNQILENEDEQSF